MKERPILFSASMVRALLAGRKTQTRRVVRPGLGQKWLSLEALEKVRRFEHRGDGWWSLQVGEAHRISHCGVDMDGGHIGSVRCPQGRPGDRIWVKETHGLYQIGSEWRIAYRADGENASIERWKPCIFMRRTASRTTLELTQVRVERLKEISDEDAIAEGIEPGQWRGAPVWGPPARNYRNPVSAYADLWESINGAGSWGANPWVWALTFRRLP